MLCSISYKTCSKGKEESLKKRGGGGGELSKYIMDFGTNWKEYLKIELVYSWEIATNHLLMVPKKDDFVPRIWNL